MSDAAVAEAIAREEEMAARDAESKREADLRNAFESYVQKALPLYTHSIVRPAAVSELCLW